MQLSFAPSDVPVWTHCGFKKKYYIVGGSQTFVLFPYSASTKLLQYPKLLFLLFLYLFSFSQTRGKCVGLGKLETHLDMCFELRNTGMWIQKKNSNFIYNTVIYFDIPDSRFKKMQFFRKQLLVQGCQTLFSTKSNANNSRNSGQIFKIKTVLESQRMADFCGVDWKKIRWISCMQWLTEKQVEKSRDLFTFSYFIGDIFIIRM